MVSCDLFCSDCKIVEGAQKSVNKMGSSARKKREKKKDFQVSSMSSANLVNAKFTRKQN